MKSVTSEPRPPVPRVVAWTAALLALVALVALVAGARPFAAYVALCALLPVGRRPRHRSWGSGLMFGAIGWELLGLAPSLRGSRLDGPYGGPPALFAVALVVTMLRVWALRAETAVRWTDRSWTLPAAPIDSLLSTIAAALKALPADRDARSDRAVAALAAASAAAVPAPEHERRAFWVNVYNVLSTHASRGRRSTRLFDVLEVYRTEYAICGKRLSLDEIEHGLLRANSRAPGRLRRPLRVGDVRLAWAVPLDPRIHFALNCSARSCPPVRVYRGEALDAQLDLAMKAFIEAETEVDGGARTVRTSRILRWYARDFGGPAGVLALVAGALEVAEAKLSGMKLVYRPYDWSLHDGAPGTQESVAARAPAPPR